MVYVRVLLAIVDFMLKAAAAYVATPEGKNEWADIEIAFEVASNNDDNEGIEYAASAPSETAKRILRH